MTIIVFDLETTDLHSCGQILNYCFMADDHTGPKSMLSGDIGLEPHQLPSVESIKVTGIDVSKDIFNYLDTEFQAMQNIHRYLTEIIENSQSKVFLIGHNISRFDLNFLRTSMIRNGFNPYFGRNVSYADTIHLAKKLVSMRPELAVPNFKLSTLIENWIGKQKFTKFHDSSADAGHAKTLINFLEDNGVSVFSQTYEPRGNSANQIFFRDGQIFERPMVKISENRTYALWLDLSVDYKTLGRDAVSWYKKDLSSFIVSKNRPSEDIVNEALTHVAENDRTYYSIDTFFEPPVCDIENHIYMMPFNELDCLSQAIHKNRPQAIKDTSDHCHKLYLRYVMKNSQFKHILKDYVKARYVSNKFVVDKQDPSICHWSLKDEYAKLNKDPELETSLPLQSLKKLYEDFAKKFDISFND